MSCSRHHYHTNRHSPCCSCSCSCSHSITSCFNVPCCPGCSTGSAACSPSDQLLQALLLIQQSNPPPPSPSILFTTPHSNSFNHKQPRDRRHHHQHQQQQDEDEEDYSHPVLRSLTRRVSALESSLSNLSPISPPQRHPRQAQAQAQAQQLPLPKVFSQPQSLKHLAAVTIQRYFRRLLARRSRALRDLKLLASLKSHAAALRSSLSDPRIVKTSAPGALSQRVMDLLSQLDSIDQSSDPMIREGKRAVSKELLRISEFVDKVVVAEKKRNDGESNGNADDGMSELEGRRDRGRRVSFAVENGVMGEDDLFDDFSERILEVEGHPLMDQMFLDGEEESLKIRRPGKANGGSQGMTNGGLGLAAPTPAMMEPRRNNAGG